MNDPLRAFTLGVGIALRRQVVAAEPFLLLAKHLE